MLSYMHMQFRSVIRQINILIIDILLYLLFIFCISLVSTNQTEISVIDLMCSIVSKDSWRKQWALEIYYCHDLRFLSILECVCLISAYRYYKLIFFSCGN